MCGASSSEKQISQQQQDNLNTMSNEASQAFGQSSQVFQQLSSAFSPVLAAGPGQSGFTPAELANLKSQAITNTGVATRNAQQAAGERGAAQGGGTTILPSGAQMGQNAAIAEAGAQQTAGELSNINLQNAQLGQQNWMNAAGVLSGATNTFNASTGLANAATGAGSAAFSSANSINQQNQQWSQDLINVASSAAGTAGSILCPAEGSLYLMADGSEKPVEELVTGEQGMDENGSPNTIEEITTSVVPVIRVCTENGFSTRNSETHCFTTPSGFVISVLSLGTLVNTARGPSRVVVVEPDGEARVFSVITKSHSYRADGVWAYGVGHVASDEACKEYLNEFTMTTAGGR
jgi:hypothetical protein